jgi:hypothetical protein
VIFPTTHIRGSGESGSNARDFPDAERSAEHADRRDRANDTDGAAEHMISVPAPYGIIAAPRDGVELPRRRLVRPQLT